MTDFSKFQRSKKARIVLTSMDGSERKFETFKEYDQYILEQIALAKTKGKPTI